AGGGREVWGGGPLPPRLAGPNNAKNGLPTYDLLTAPHKDDQYSRELNRVVVGSRPGPLGPAYAPFVPSGGGPATANLRLNLPADRLEDRRDLLRRLDGLKRGLDDRDAAAGYDQFERQAVDPLTARAAKA